MLLLVDVLLDAVQLVDEQVEVLLLVDEVVDVVVVEVELLEEVLEDVVCWWMKCSTWWSLRLSLLKSL